MSWNRLVVPLALIAAAACGDIVPSARDGGADDGGADEADAAGPPCPERFSERIEGDCVPVTVTGFEEIPVEIASGELTLRGILTRPVTAGHYVAPGVVFQNAPGPVDADHHVSGELRRSFEGEVPIHAQLAEDLARAGVAVLRHDTRTCFAEDDPRCLASRASYPGDPMAALGDAFADDTAAAASWLAARPEVRDRDVTVVGQGYGGVYVPALALREQVVSGGVLLGSPAMSFVDTLAIPYERWADDLEEEDPENPRIQELRAQAAELRRVMGEIESGTYPSKSFADRPVGFWQNQIEWHRRLQDEFLSAAAAEPLLVLAGDLDDDVPLAHADLYGTWAAEADVPAPVILRDHGHWLVQVAEGSPESRISPEVSQHILDWLAPAE